MKSPRVTLVFSLAYLSPLPPLYRSPGNRGEGVVETAGRDAFGNMLAADGDTLCAVCARRVVRPLRAPSCRHVACARCWMRALRATPRTCPLCGAHVKRRALEKAYFG